MFSIDMFSCIHFHVCFSTPSHSPCCLYRLSIVSAVYLWPSYSLLVNRLATNRTKTTGTVCLRYVCIKADRFSFIPFENIRVLLQFVRLSACLFAPHFYCCLFASFALMMCPKIRITHFFLLLQPCLCSLTPFGRCTWSCPCMLHTNTH